MCQHPLAPQGRALPVVPLEAPPIHAALPIREIVFEQLVDNLDVRIVREAFWTNFMPRSAISHRPPRSARAISPRVLGGVPRIPRLLLPVPGELSLGGGPRPALEGVNQAGCDADDPGGGHRRQQGKQAGHDGPCRAHFQTRSGRPTGRAEMGSPRIQRPGPPRASGRSGTCRRGSFSRHFSEIVSRSRHNRRVEGPRRYRSGPITWTACPSPPQLGTGGDPSAGVKARPERIHIGQGSDFSRLAPACSGGM